MASAGGPLLPGRRVRIHRVELAPSERSDSVPQDTASVPFETWINGWLVEAASLGERTAIRTATGRVVEGELVEVDPGYDHSFGAPPPALERVGEKVRFLLFESQS
jgi:hypothetical protein